LDCGIRQKKAFWDFGVSVTGATEFGFPKN